MLIDEATQVLSDQKHGQAACASDFALAGGAAESTWTNTGAAPLVVEPLQRLPAAGSRMAETLLELAADVERQDLAIKQAILSAAHQDDSPRVARIVQRWLELPTSQVLAEPLEPVADEARMDPR